MTPLVLGYRIEKSASPPTEFIPFRVRDGQLLTPARKTFSQKENLVVYFQVLGLSPGLRSSGELKYDFLRKDVQFQSHLKKIGEYQNAPGFLETFPLQDFPPDYYKIRVTVLDPGGAGVLVQDEDFEITAAPSIGRPIVISKVMPASGAGEYDYEVGLQLLNMKRNKDALVFLEKAYNGDPSQLSFALGLCQALFIEGQYQRIKDILGPLSGVKATDRVLYLLGKSAHSLGQMDEAIAIYTEYLSRFGMNLEMLNLLGTAYYQKGNAAEALRAWKRSLEINPGQENIKKLVQMIEEKTKR
jgi:tetratricopeptide (TPR) repeat protein